MQMKYYRAKVDSTYGMTMKNKLKGYFMYPFTE